MHDAPDMAKQPDTAKPPDARIELVAYDPAWPAAFERECQSLTQAMAPWLVGQPQHIGSTAVPGLIAKPVIDIMAPVQSLAAARPAIVAAAQLAYLHAPYQPALMHWFCKPAPHLRTHHLHLVPAGSARWQAQLAFRDALRADAGLRAEYAALKQQLALLHPQDRDAYTAAKAPFIAKVLGPLGLASGSGQDAVA